MTQEESKKFEDYKLQSGMFKFVSVLLLVMLLLSFLNTHQVREEEYQSGYEIGYDNGYKDCKDEYGL